MSPGGTPLTDEARAAFEECLAHADEDAGVRLTRRLLADGVSPQDVLLGLVAPAQRAVGRRWRTGAWTVAQEHQATHVSEVCVDAVAASVPEPAEPAGHVAVVCGDGEWHTLPARLLTQVLRVHGFRARFLGGHVPAARLLSDIHQNAPDVVALSCTLPTGLPLAHPLVEGARSAGVPVLAGGAGFGPGGLWAPVVGADLYAADAADAVDLLHQRWPPRVAETGSSVDPAAADAYAWFDRRRTALLGELIDGMHTRFPELGGAPGHEQEQVAQNLGYLMDSLAAAVFVGDVRLFTGHLAYVVEYLTARGRRLERLSAALDMLDGLLAETPRFTALLAEGRTRVGPPPAKG